MMEWKRKRNLAVRYSVMSAGFIAGFWTTWYFTGGSVPVSQLFALSRWWDVLLGPLFSFVFVFLLTNDWIEERALMPSFASDFFGVSLICSPFLGLVFGLEVGFITGMILLPLSLLMLYIDNAVRGKIKNFLLGN